MHAQLGAAWAVRGRVAGGSIIARAASSAPPQSTRSGNPKRSNEMSMPSESMGCSG